MTYLESVALLLPPPRPTTVLETPPGSHWRGVCELPGTAPADMAIRVGRAALAATGRPQSDVQWVLHGGSGLQGSAGWPMHHHVQNGIVGAHGNAVEIKQYCSGGLTSVMLAAGVIRGDGAAICTGADNWSWGDRFAATRAVGGEPFSDVAHAAVLSDRNGFARILGVGTGSCPDQADVWQTGEFHWESADLDDYAAAYGRAARSRRDEDTRATLQMIAAAVTAALKDAQVSPQHVTHFIPHGSGSGEPYRSLARALGLPWSQALYEHTLDVGYLGVSTQFSGLVKQVETGSVTSDSIVLVLATEYLLSATALVLHVTAPPVLTSDSDVTVMA